MLSRVSFLLIIIPFFSFGQDQDWGEVHGDFSLNAQTYTEDPSINAAKVDEFFLMNGYSNIRFTKGNFTTGLRYESYLNALQDFDSRHNGNGIPYRFAQYTIDGLDITVGNFYEQFGNGLIFRSYEEKDLGIDNSMDGVRLKYSPIQGIDLKGFVGKQRFFFEHGPGIVRGLDAELNMNDLLFKNWSASIIHGFSFVSRFQEDLNPIYNIPENVGAFAFRTTINKGKFSFNSELAHKINDPKGGISYNNYAPGSAAIANLTYSQRGMGIIIEAHRIDNFDFRSDRSANGKELTLSFIPTITKQHTYTLAAFYPFATQPMGEFGLQGEVNYSFKKKSTIGGKYGTKIFLNYARVNALNGGHSVLTTEPSETHTPMLISIKGEDLYFRDFNFGFKKKINRKIKVTVNYVDLIYNKDIIQGKNYGKNIHAKIAVLDINYKIKPKHTLRTELQYLSTNKSDEFDVDQGDWAMALLEYTVSPNWFFAIADQYNFGYTDHEGIQHDPLHYFNVNCGYTKRANRFTIGYGKKREGVFCVGGICKNVPSSNGFTLSITSSF